MILPLTFAVIRQKAGAVWISQDPHRFGTATRIKEFFNGNKLFFSLCNVVGEWIITANGFSVDTLNVNSSICWEYCADFN